MSFSPMNLFEEIPRTTNGTCGSWLRRLRLQGQSVPQWICSPSLVSPTSQEITMNTYVPTHWHPKAPSSTSGAEIQFHAVCRLLSPLAKEKLLHCPPLARCVLCVACFFWSVWTLIPSYGKLIDFHHPRFSADPCDSTAFPFVSSAKRGAESSHAEVRR